MSSIARIALLTTCIAVVAVGCSSAPSTTDASGTTTTTGSPSASDALKSIDQAALQTVVENATKEMLVPGAFVAIRTPQGSYTAAVGTTELGKQIPPTRTPTSGSPRTPRP